MISRSQSPSQLFSQFRVTRGRVACAEKNIRGKKTPVVSSPELSQAEIFCEQARDAARMKRFQAALGLFSTAQTCLQTAMQSGGAVRREARRRLQSLSHEIAVYKELARSSERPFHRFAL